MKDKINIVSAGAGSGKTYRLASEILDAIEKKEARPEGILLTTFTRKAAAELEERVRVRLLTQGKWEEAQCIRQAWIGTIDSVCLRLIQEYAFQAGQSPQIAVFAAGEDLTEFNRAVTDTVNDEELELLNSLSESLTIKHWSDPDRDWRSIVKDIVDAARANRIDPEELTNFSKRSVERYLKLFLKPSKSAEEIDKALLDQLNKASQGLQATIDKGHDTTRTTAGMLDTIRRVKGRFQANGAIPWADWVRLSKSSVSVKSKPLIAGLINVASLHPGHPQLHGEIRTLIELLFKIARDSLSCYQARKRSAGLLDFIDLEEFCLRLLDDKEVRAALKERLDLVLVDEFQDTSPVQLALFLKLAELAKRSVWVGDQKQSIFEFRRADPMLMQSVLDAIGHSDRLKQSFRSRPHLVGLVNQSFERVFPKQGIAGEIKLEPNREETLTTPPCESWILTTKSVDADTQAIALRIREILDRPKDYPVIDRRCGERRSIKPGDICVLTRNNDASVKLAQAIGRCAIAVELARPGLMRCPEVTLAVAGLRLLLNPTDSIAAAQLTFLRNATGAKPEQWLIPRLEQLKNLEATRRAGQEADSFIGWGGDATLKYILEHQRDYGSLSPLELLHEAMGLSGVRDMCVRWGHPPQRLANLEQLILLTQDYQEAVQARGEASSIAGLLAYLYRLKGQEQDALAMGGADAVRVSTYHGAKGVEWHMVILYQLDQEPKNWLFQPSVESSSAFNFENPLQDRWIRYWPWPYGNYRKDVFLDQKVEGTQEHKTALRQAENEVIRLLYVGMTRARDYLVFAARQGKHKWLDQLSDSKGTKTFYLPQNGKAPGFRIVSLKETEPPAPTEEAVTWFTGGPSRTDRKPKVIYCSNLVVPDDLLNLVKAFPEKIMDRTPITGDPNMTMLGNAVHGFFGCDCTDLTPQQKESVAYELLEAHGVAGCLRPNDLMKIWDGFTQFIHSRWPGAKIHREWPIAVKLNGFELHGTADLVLEMTDGYLIIDHKTYPGDLDGIVARAKTFAAQLAAYQLAIKEYTQQPIVSVIINFPLSGYLVKLEVAATEDLLRSSLR